MHPTSQELPNVLLIEADDETRPLLGRYLFESGFDLIVCVDAEEASERLREGCHRPSVILLNQVGQSVEQFLEMGRQVRQHGSLPDDTPIVVMAEQYTDEQEGETVQVGRSEYVTYLESGQQLLALLRDLCLLRNIPVATTDRDACSCGCSGAITSGDQEAL